MRTALITGGNRGLGLGTARELGRRGLRVVLGARDRAQGEDAAAVLRREGVDALAVTLDVTSDASVAAAAEQVAALGVDVLVNNAGITGGTRYRTPATEVSLDEVRHVHDVNVLGALRMVQALAPAMAERGWGRIVNVSSGMGQLSDMGTGALPYRLSKVALNGLTRVLANELRGTGVLVNAVCPGWVRTDMGGPGATRSVEEGVAGIVWAATLPDDGPTGGFFRDGKPIPW